MVDGKQTSKKMTSIARRINIRFWLGRLMSMLTLDIVVVVLIIVTIIYWRTDFAGFSMFYDRSKLTYDIIGRTYNSFALVTTYGENIVDTFYLYNIFDYLLLPLCILLAFQLVQLTGDLFHTNDIRRSLKPLNDLAVKAEEISSIAGNESYTQTDNLEHLENAISKLSPDAVDIKVSTGDKDLQSIEVALNNLLSKMQESKRQQMRFVSDASHELRTPISVIQGYVNMLDRWGKDDESVLEESIEALKNESEHMKELVEQLLFLARGDSGRNTLKNSEFDMAEVMQEVCDESAMIDAQHEYQYTQTEATPVKFYGDRAMIKQSMRIFIQNAAKYSAAGDTIKLGVSMNQDEISYTIQDEGIGMQSSEVVHIFERFYRSDEARNENTGGSGLGLSIAKWIIDAHEGRIDVLSRPDFGTRFTVSFKCQGLA